MAVVVKGDGCCASPKTRAHNDNWYVNPARNIKLEGRYAYLAVEGHGVMITFGKVQLRNSLSWLSLSRLFRTFVECTTMGTGGSSLSIMCRGSSKPHEPVIRSAIIKQEVDGCGNSGDHAVSRPMHDGNPQPAEKYQPDCHGKSTAGRLRKCCSPPSPHIERPSRHAGSSAEASGYFSAHALGQ